MLQRLKTVSICFFIASVQMSWLCLFWYLILEAKQSLFICYLNKPDSLGGRAPIRFARGRCFESYPYCAVTYDQGILNVRVTLIQTIVCSNTRDFYPYEQRTHQKSDCKRHGVEWSGVEWRLYLQYLERVTRDGNCKKLI